MSSHTLRLQNMEDYQDESGGVQVSSQTSMLKFGLWVNISKNPRLKTVDFPQLGISLEVRPCLLVARNGIIRTRAALEQVAQHLSWVSVLSILIPFKQSAHFCLVLYIVSTCRVDVYSRCMLNISSAGMV